LTISALAPVVLTTPDAWFSKVSRPLPSWPAPEIVLSMFGQLVGRGRAIDEVRRKVGQRHLTAALQRQVAAVDHQEGVVAGRVQRDRAGVVQRAADRQRVVIVDGDCAGIRPGARSARGCEGAADLQSHICSDRMFAALFDVLMV
jgi:hypothetical protein